MYYGNFQFCRTPDRPPPPNHSATTEGREKLDGRCGFTVFPSWSTVPRRYLLQKRAMMRTSSWCAEGERSTYMCMYVRTEFHDDILGSLVMSVLGEFVGTTDEKLLC